VRPRVQQLEQQIDELLAGNGTPRVRHLDRDRRSLRGEPARSLTPSLELGGLHGESFVGVCRSFLIVTTTELADTPKRWAASRTVSISPAR
jgi:hypothetical protein